MKRIALAALLICMLVCGGLLFKEYLVESQHVSITYRVPKNFKGLIIVHGSNTIVNEAEGDHIYLRVDAKGQTTINRKYQIIWHSIEFESGGRAIRLWIERSLPTDSATYVFQLDNSNRPFIPPDYSDAFFVGTAAEYHAFLKKYDLLPNP